MSRDFDLILYGATGFTGRQAAAYLAKHAPSGLRWAIAGRDETRLAALGLDRPVLVAATDRPAELDRLARAGRAILNMAGPFKRHGDPLVMASIRAGTDYCDISGETARIRGLIDRHGDAAVSNRVRIVVFCGASSLPADLAVHLLDQHFGGKLIEAKAGVSITGGSFNGGTIASISDAIESGDTWVERNPFLLGPADRAPEPRERDPNTIGFDEDLRAWTTPSPMGVSDTRAVRLSATLRGRDIIFQEYLVFEGKGAWRRAAAAHALLAAIGAAFLWRPTRGLLRRLTKPGHGPTEQRMDAASYAIRVWGRDVDGSIAQVRISGKGDPGNRITVKCACESALALTLDRDALPEQYGVLTPSVALGETIVRRLAATDISITLASPWSGRTLLACASKISKAAREEYDCSPGRPRILPLSRENCTIPSPD